METTVENKSEYIMGKQKEPNNVTHNTSANNIISIAGNTVCPFVRITSAPSNESPLICIDSKKEPHKQIEDLDSNKIASISVLKGRVAIKE
jgi:hypothetical protein